MTGTNQLLLAVLANQIRLAELIAAAANSSPGAAGGCFDKVRLIQADTQNMINYFKSTDR